MAATMARMPKGPASKADEHAVVARKKSMVEHEEELVRNLPPLLHRLASPLYPPPCTLHALHGRLNSSFCTPLMHRHAARSSTTFIHYQAAR